MTQKLQARPNQPPSELTKLKAIWRGMADDARAYWVTQFVSDRSQAALRDELRAKLKINLRFDKQLNQFRAWVDQQEILDNQAEQILDNEARLTAQHPDWTLDQIREEVIKASYAATLATGDFKLGLRTVVQDLNVKKVTLDRDKFEFNAAKAALAALETLRKIKTNSGLTEDQKIQQARLELFGEAALPPEEAAA